MARGVESVEDLYREWTVGRNGNQSIQELERLYKARWRNSSTETAFYLKRLKVVKGIQKWSRHHDVTMIQAAFEIEAMRLREGIVTMLFYLSTGRSIDWLAKNATWTQFTNAIRASATELVQAVDQDMHNET